MSIYDKYASRSVAYNMVVGAIILLNIGGTAQIVKLLYLINYGTSIFKFAYVVALALPFLFYSLLPFIGSIAVIVFFMKQEASSRMMVLSTCQMTRWQIIKPALFVPLICMFFAFYVSIDLMPRAYMKLNSQLHQIKTSFNQNVLRAGEFIKISEKVTLYIDEKDESGNLKNVMIFHDRDKFSEVIIAKSAMITLKDEILTLLLKDGRREVIGRGSRVRQASFTRMTIDINTGDKFPDKKPKNPNSYFISELLNQPPGQDVATGSFIIEGFNRLIWPLYNFLLPALAVAIFMVVPVRRKFSLYKSVAISAVVVTLSLVYFGIQNSTPYDFRVLFMLAISFTIFVISACLLYPFSCGGRRL